MSKRHFLRNLILVPTIILMTAIPALANQCPDLVEADCAGGTAWFGLRHDGANIGQGQSVTLICDSAILGVDFMFVVTGNPNGGVPSLLAGDEIHVDLIDADENHLVTVTTAVPTDLFDDWLEFSFPDGLVVPAGEYRFAAYTTVERVCAFRFGYGEGADCYDGGYRVTSYNGSEGPWFHSTTNDVPFRLHLDSSSVATEILSWGSVKGMYR